MCSHIPFIFIVLYVILENSDINIELVLLFNFFVLVYSVRYVVDTCGSIENDNDPCWSAGGEITFWNNYSGRQLKTF